MCIHHGPTTPTDRQLRRRRRIMRRLRALTGWLFVVGLVYVLLFLDPVVPWSFQG